MAPRPALVLRIPADAFPEGSHALPQSPSPGPANTVQHPGPCCAGSRVPAGRGPHPLERAARAAFWSRSLRRCHRHRPAVGCHCFPPVHLRAGARRHHPPAPAGHGGRLTGARSYWCHCHCLPPGYICACGLGRHHTEKVLGLLNSIKHFSVTQPACLQPSTAPELSAWGPGRNGAKDTGKALQALCWAAVHRVLIVFGVCVISWVAQIWQGLSTPLRRNLWQSVALNREFKRILLGLVWVMGTVLGITLHSFPREGLFMGVSHPKFMCNPILTHCIWASCTGGDWGGEE